MRASSLAAIVVIALAMVSTQPIVAADRTVPSPGEVHQASLLDWIGNLGRALIGIVQPAPVGPAPWSRPAAHAADSDAPDKSVEDALREAVANSVILEDGAPF